VTGVVVGYVPTATGFSAIREAEREALARNAEVVVVNVIGPRGYTAPTAADEQTLDAVLEHLRGVGVRCSVREVSGEAAPSDILLGVAREIDADLIVLGMHQRSWLAKRALGSTVRSVALAAHCPVLVVPDVDEPAEPPKAPPLRSLGQE
jgi:nucleotide-binding universal stress UspA family protein